MNIRLRDGLPFITATIEYRERRVTFPWVLLDTGSAGCIFSTDKLLAVDLRYEPDDSCASYSRCRRCGVCLHQEGRSTRAWRTSGRRLRDRSWCDGVWIRDGWDYRNGLSAQNWSGHRSTTPGDSQVIVVVIHHSPHARDSRVSPLVPGVCASLLLPRPPAR